MNVKLFCANMNMMKKRTNRVQTVDRVLLFCVLQADFADSTVLCFVGYVYPPPHFGLASLGEPIWDEPAQYISMRAPETTRVVPNRESLS